jgi:hypothetical protein
MGQAKANRAAHELAEASRAAGLCGLTHDEVSAPGGNAGWRTVMQGCRRQSGHDGLCDWEMCGEGATGDPYCDVECQRERGHTGPHRHEWETP